MNEGVTILTILSFIISNPCSYRASLKKLEDRVNIYGFSESRNLSELKHKPLIYNEFMFFYFIKSFKINDLRYFNVEFHWIEDRLQY
jgi:hypothetical protein